MVNFKQLLPRHDRHGRPGGRVEGGGYSGFFCLSPAEVWRPTHAQGGDRGGTAEGVIAMRLGVEFDLMDKGNKRGSQLFWRQATGAGGDRWAARARQAQPQCWLHRKKIMITRAGGEPAELRAEERQRRGAVDDCPCRFPLVSLASASPSV